ncbi:MAG: hypothetical protein Q7J85_09870 [Bacillota bacterium]|nr:hypothetical protein [Bacillota bacterium]
MIGMEDPWIALVWWLCVLSAIGGAIYGVINWNHEEKIKIKTGKGVNKK